MPEPVTYTPPSVATQTGTLAVAGSAAALIAWGLKEFAGIEMSGEVVAAVSVIIGWAVGKWGT